MGQGALRSMSIHRSYLAAKLTISAILELSCLSNYSRE
jgi:hypothetical protein